MSMLDATTAAYIGRLSLRVDSFLSPTGQTFIKWTGRSIAVTARMITMTAPLWALTLTFLLIFQLKMSVVAFCSSRCIRNTNMISAVTAASVWFNTPRHRLAHTVLTSLRSTCCRFLFLAQSHTVHIGQLCKNGWTDWDAGLYGYAA